MSRLLYQELCHVQALFRRGQLKALVDLHSETEGLGGQLAAEEINVIRGALDLTNKTAAKGMTPLDKVGAHPSATTHFMGRIATPDCNRQEK